jgi:hypothetical protein
MLTTIACHGAPAQGVGGARGCALGSVTNLRELDLRYALFVSSYLSAYGCMLYFVFASGCAAGSVTNLRELDLRYACS